MSSKEGEDEEDVQPRRLELSLNPQDGSLLTAPLSTVVLAATDSLYTDLYQMAHGEVDVAHAMEDDQAAHVSKEKMSNLSFAQRRHELAWRLAQHSKGLAHVAALTAANASSSSANATRVSTRALQHARTAWVQADEAQDALYFFHAQLFPARQAPHDVYGALDLLLQGQWNDLPTDIKLKMDRYESSREYKWPAKEVADRWHTAVLHKLWTGEVAWMKRTSLKSLWNITLQGGVIKLFYGNAKRVGGGTTKYPVEALLSVLSTSPNAEWTLLSIQVAAQAKTGESNHQLDMTNRQRFDLHRLCALAMSKEESRKRDDEDKDKSCSCPVARPLECLFQVAHQFDLSWQLEILSAQAQALKRGVWATADSTLQVTPVEFFGTGGGPVLGRVSISFWNVDDRHGPPRVGDLRDADEEQEEEPFTTNGGKTSKEDVTAAANRYTLSIRAVINAGMRISLSGGHVIMEAAKNDERIRDTVQKLLNAASDPFALSASDALLAATTLCGEQKCHAVVKALRNSNVLPPWMRLSVERGSIAVAAQITYGVQSSCFVILFRLECDSRTGMFISTFPRSARLLRLLSCNDSSANEFMTLVMAKMAQHRKKGVAATATGRFVRDAFDGLMRSMNLLGQRTGVGGEWNNVNDESTSLRQRAIQLACADAKVCLATCCGVAAVYGLSSLALGAATGVSAVADMTGGALGPVDGIALMPTPPVSVVMDQRMIQKVLVSSDGDKRKQPLLEKDLFAMSCTITDDAVTLHGFDVTIQMESPTSMPSRLQVSPVPFQSPTPEESKERPKKRSRKGSNGNVTSSPTSSDLMSEVAKLADVISNTLEL